jgi:hypothetical protein
LISRQPLAPCGSCPRWDGPTAGSSRDRQPPPPAGGRRRAPCPADSPGSRGDLERLVWAGRPPAGLPGHCRLLRLSPRRGFGLHVYADGTASACYPKAGLAGRGLVLDARWAVPSLRRRGGDPAPLARGHHGRPPGSTGRDRRLSRDAPSPGCTTRSPRLREGPEGQGHLPLRRRTTSRARHHVFIRGRGPPVLPGWADCGVRVRAFG